MRLQLLRSDAYEGGDQFNSIWLQGVKNIKDSTIFLEVLIIGILDDLAAYGIYMFDLLKIPRQFHSYVAHIYYLKCFIESDEQNLLIL